MKKLLIFSFLLTTFVGCEKGQHHKGTSCPVLTAESVPQAAKDAFTAKYKSATVDTWYNKDNSHLVAKFIIGSKITYSSFSNTGVFENEKIKWENEEGDNQNNNDNNNADEDRGCDCETGD